MIEKYFESIFLILIAQHNRQARLSRFTTDEEKEQFVVTEIHQEDVVQMLTMPFGILAKHRKKGPDIQIDELDIQAEVQHLRWWLQDNKKIKLTWDQHLQPDFDWLIDQKVSNIKNRALIFSWSPECDWRNIVQLGAGQGKNRNVNKDRMDLLPYVSSDEDTIDTLYSNGRSSGSIEVQRGSNTVHLNWKRYGTDSDLINFSIYY